MKGISAELRDPRKDEKWWPALRALDPCQTVLTMLDGDRSASPIACATR